MEEHRKAIGVLCAVTIIAGVIMTVISIPWLRMLTGLIAVTSFLFVWVLARASEQDEPNGSWQPRVRPSLDDEEEYSFYIRRTIWVVLSLAGMVLGTIPGLGVLFWFSVCAFICALVSIAMRYFPFTPPEPGD